VEALSEGVWVLSDGLARGAVVQMSDGRLWVTVATPVAGLDELGQVAHLVVADARHAHHLPAWAERYPDAHLWSVGLGDTAGLPIHTPLADHAPAQWNGELQLRQVRGNGHSEAWFVHRNSRTAILPRAAGARERWAFFGLRRHLSAAVRWLENADVETILGDGAGLVRSDISAHLDRHFAWVGADGPIPPAMRFALGANPGGAAAFAVALAAVAGLLAGLTMEAPSMGVRLVTALVLGDVTCGVVAQSLPSTRAWWSKQPPSWRAGLLGVHIAHPLLMVVAWGGSATSAVSLWLLALVGAAVPRSLSLAVVVLGAVIFADQLPGPAWWPALYLLKLGGQDFRYPISSAAR